MIKPLLHFFFSLLLACNFLVAIPAKTIGIFTVQFDGVDPWDPDSIHSGITGSEEAVIYMSQSLAKLGYKVLVFGNPPRNSRHLAPQANPRFIRFNGQNIPRLDIAISWRLPHIGAELKKCANKVYFWPHDVCRTALSKAEISAFNDVLWLSEWQRRQWISMNPSFASFKNIFGNGVVLEQFHKVKPRDNPYSCIYGSNYSRGLEILLDLWPAVKKKFPKATLDIYYGWQHWGLLSPSKEAQMRAQISELAPLGVQEHGLVSHEELNQAYEKASFWTYPCIQDETFCITALKAQLCGAVPVVIENAALAETVQYGYKCLKREEYFDTLIKALQEAEKISTEERANMGQFICEQFSWDHLALKWKELFDR